MNLKTEISKKPQVQLGTVAIIYPRGNSETLQKSVLNAIHIFK